MEKNGMSAEYPIDGWENARVTNHGSWPIQWTNHVFPLDVFCNPDPFHVTYFSIWFQDLRLGDLIDASPQFSMSSHEHHMSTWKSNYPSLPQRLAASQQNKAPKKLLTTIVDSQQTCVVSLSFSGWQLRYSPLNHVSFRYQVKLRGEIWHNTCTSYLLNVTKMLSVSAIISVAEQPNISHWTQRSSMYQKQLVQVPGGRMGTRKTLVAKTESTF